jgi:hypothetical protein
VYATLLSRRFESLIEFTSAVGNLAMEEAVATSPGHPLEHAFHVACGSRFVCACKVPFPHPSSRKMYQSCVPDLMLRFLGGFCCGAGASLSFLFTSVCSESSRPILLATETGCYVFRSAFRNAFRLVAGDGGYRKVGDPAAILV